MNPAAHEAERGLGAALRAMLAAWLVLALLQVVYAGSFFVQVHYLSRRSYFELPTWLAALQQAVRLALLLPMWLLAGAALRYAQVTLARDRVLALAAAAALGLAAAIDLALAGRESLERAQLWQGSLSWLRTVRWVFIVQGVVEVAGLGLLGAALSLGGSRRGARTPHWLWLPLVVRGLLPTLMSLLKWFPDWRHTGKVYLTYGGLLALLLAAALLFALLLSRHAAVAPVLARRGVAAVALRGHASAMLARLVVLVGVAVLTVAAARARSLDLLKFVMVVGPLATFAISLWLLAVTLQFAWSSVDAGLLAHLAAALLLATLLMEAHAFVLVLGLFWGDGNIMDRAEQLQKVAPMLSLLGQVLGVAALLALLRVLARVGAAAGLGDAGARALRVGGGLLALVVAATVLARPTQLLGARPDGAATMLLFGVLLLAGAIALFAAYVRLVRDVAYVLEPPAPRW